MRRYYKHTVLLLSLCAAFAACNDSEALPDNPATGGEVGEKTPIELSVGGVDSQEPAATRAVITDEISGRMQAFTENTSLYMLMQSDYVGSGDAKDPQVTRTIMFALPQTDNTKNYSDVNYSASNEYSKFVRYWDDTYAREAAISIVAVCTPGMGPNVPNQTNTKAWRTGGNTAYANQGWTAKTGDASYPSISWPIGNDGQVDKYDFLTDQSKPFDGVSYIKNQDLCFSNNLNDYTSKSGTDRRIKFIKDSSTGKGHFDTTKRLIFYHALSKLTFCIKKGEGFSDAEFTFKENTNIELTNFYSQGTFNLEDGEFVTSSLKKANGESGQNPAISKIHLRTDAEKTDAEKTNYKYILDALVIPGTDLSDDDADVTDAVSFIIGGNKYILNMAQLYAAFSADQKTSYFNSGKLKAGVHYVFTLTLGKTQIKNLTATIADWEQVTADNITPTNARIKLNLEERAGDVLVEVNDKEDKFTLYRTADNIGADAAISDNHAVYNWMTGYTENTTPSFVAATDGVAAHWTTNWYWESSKHFYHFRVLTEAHGENAKSAVTTTLSSDTKGVYLQLQASETLSESAYKDICWGAPMLDDAKDETPSSTLKWNYGPTKNGFDGKDEIDFTKTENAGKHQIYKAIGPTEDQIKLILFHMMSDVTFKITTSGSDDPDHVVFKDGSKVTKIELQKIYKTGNLYLGNGLVTGVYESGKTVKEDYTFTETPEPNTNNEVIWSNYGAIPQDLTDVVLVITTADNNQYKVKMEDVLATSVSNNNIVNPYTKPQGSEKYQINRWYPGYKYTYTFKLTKKGITDLQATIVDWEVVEAGDDTVQIE